MTSPPAEAGGFNPRGLSFLLHRPQPTRNTGKGRWTAHRSYTLSADVTSRQPGGRPDRLGYHRPGPKKIAHPSTCAPRVLDAGFALAANRLSLSCCAGDPFPPRPEGRGIHGGNAMSLNDCPGSVTSHAQNDRTGRCCWCGTYLYPPVPAPPLKGWRTNLEQAYRRHYDPDYGTNPLDY